MSYVFNMDKGLIAYVRSVQQARDKARRRDRELREFCSGGTIVFVGFLAAVLYKLLTHQI
jgi:hypothetical protein